MNTYKSIVSFALLLIAIRGGNTLYTPLDEKAKCENGKLVQYSNYYVCICDEGKVHDTDLKCVIPVTAPCKKVGDICSDYAKCVVDEITPVETYKCQCNNGYESIDIAPNKQKCIPKGCKDMNDKCGKGICSKKNDNEAMCACHIGNKLDTTTQSCIVDDKNVDCKLTCIGENFGCVLNDKKEFYDCGCKEGYELKEGKCVEIVVNKYIPLNASSVCVNATLIQYTNHYECMCDQGKVHVSDLKCDDPIVGDCTENDKICGEYAKCVTEGEKKICKCNDGYIFNDDKPAVCVPLGCDKKDICKDGFCIKKTDKDATCRCDLGKVLDESKNICEAVSTKTECKLKCEGENRGCIEENSSYYKCGCKEGYELKEGKCTEIPKNPSSAYPASGIFNVGLLFLASSIVYVLV